MKDYSRREDDFDAYLDGRMTDAERQAFEAEIEADAELAELLDLHRTARQAMSAFRAHRVRELREKNRLDDLYAPHPPFFRKWTFWVVASGLVAVGFFIRHEFFVNKKHAPTPSIDVPYFVPPDTIIIVLPPKRPYDSDNNNLRKFVAQNLEGYDPPQVSGSEKRDTSTRLGRAEFFFFDAGNSAAALALLQPPDSANLRQSIWLRGQVFFKMGDFRRAAADFGWLANAPLRPGERVRTFGEEAAWNELCCLAMLPEAVREKQEFAKKLKKMNGAERYKNLVRKLETMSKAN